MPRASRTQNMELVEELQLSAEPPSPPKRSKYASGGQLGEALK
jgi:hypothetical protein